MDVADDPNTDILTIKVAPGEVAKSDEDKLGVIIDEDSVGNLFEIIGHLQQREGLHFRVEAERD